MQSNRKMENDFLLQLTAGNLLWSGSQVLSTNMPANGCCSMVNVEYRVTAPPCEMPLTMIRLRSIPLFSSSAMDDCTATTLHYLWHYDFIVASSAPSVFLFLHENKTRKLCWSPDQCRHNMQLNIDFWSQNLHISYTAWQCSHLAKFFYAFSFFESGAHIT